MIGAAGFAPELLSDRHGIDAEGLPPRCFITTVVQLAVMHTAERNRELVADLPAQRSGLSEAEMVGICRLSTAHQAGLRGDERQVVLVPSPARPAIHEDGALAICLRDSFGGLKESRRPL
jgi:hypothetical protein